MTLQKDRKAPAAFALALLFVLLIAAIPRNAEAQSYPNLTSALVSFSRTIQLQAGSIAVQGSYGSGITSIPISGAIAYSANLVYNENLVLSAEATTRYAQSGPPATLIVSDSSDIASLELVGSVTPVISASTYSYNLPTYSIDYKYALPLVSGSSQSVTLGTYLIPGITVPLLGITVTLGFQPTVSWSPTISGIYSANGPASVNPSVMQLTGPQTSSTATVTFSSSQPVDLFLQNPTLNLGNFQVSIVVLVWVEGAQVISYPWPIYSVGLPSVTASSSKLISFDPNYYTLYTQLQSSLGSLNTLVGSLQSTVNTLNTGLSSLQSSYSSLSSTVQQIQLSLNGLTSTVQTLQASLNSGIQQLQGLIDSVSSNVKLIQQTSIPSLNSSLQQLQGSYNDGSSRISALSGSISNLTSSFNALKSVQATLSSENTQIQQSLNNLTATFNSSIASLKNQLNSIILASSPVTSGSTSQTSSTQSQGAGATLLQLGLVAGLGAGVAIAVAAIRKRV